MSLHELMRSAKVWRAAEVPPSRILSTGFPRLDAWLPSRGWPYPSLIEILTDFEGVGALRLWLPVLAHLSQQQWLIWIASPHLPYAPALQQAGINLSRLLLVDPLATAVDETAAARKQKTTASGSPTRGTSRHYAEGELWAFEQALRFVDCGASLAWLEAIKPLHLRRLQLACETGASLGVLFRPARFAAETSPATLRLLLTPAQTGLDIQLVKSRGGSREQTCHLVLA